MKKNLIAIRIEDDERKMIEVLRKKHFINISELFRKTIREYYEKMEKKG